MTLRSVDQNRVTYPLQPTCGLVLVLDNNAACPGVRVVKQFSDRIDRRTGNADARKRIVPVRDGMLRYRGLDMTDGFVAVRDPVGIRPKLRIIDDRAQRRDGTKLAPQIVIRDPDHNRAISGFESLIGAQRLMA